MLVSESKIRLGIFFVHHEEREALTSLKVVFVLHRSVKEVLSANSEATEEHIEKQDKVLNSLGTYLNI
jgi:hypothetical protein